MGTSTAIPGPSAPSAAIPPIQNYVFVSPTGNDTTGDGSIGKPFATVSHAMATITTAAFSNRWAIWITGRINDPNPIAFKANVFIVGTGPLQGRISSPAWSLDASWGVAGDNRGGFVGCTVAGAQNWDFGAVASVEGKFYGTNAWFNNNFSFTANTGTALQVNQCTFEDCRVFGAVTLNGGQLVLGSNDFEAGVSVLESPGPGPFQLQSRDNRYAAGLAITQVASAGAGAQLLGGDYIPTLTVSGAIAVQATADAIPAAPTLLGGATLTRLTQSSSIQCAAGVTGARPAANLVTPGFNYLDTTLAKPIWWNGVAWIDATGAVV